VALPLVACLLAGRSVEDYADGEWVAALDYSLSGFVVLI
jgi:hypothetical protein